MRDNKLIAGILFLAWSVHFVLIWAFRFVPSIDYPNWLLEARVISQYGTAANPFSTCYEILAAPIPNGGFVLPVALLATFLPIEIAGKIVLSTYVIGLPLAIRSFLRSIGNTSLVWTIAILLLFNVSFVFGNFSFLLGLCLLFTVLAYAERRKGRFTNRTAVAFLALTIAVFLAHGLCAVVLFLYQLFRLCEHATTLKERGALASSILSMIIMGVYYYVARPEHMSDAIFWGLMSRQRAGLLSTTFIAGWAFPPYEFSLIRTLANAVVPLFLICVGIASMPRLIKTLSSSATAKLTLSALAITLLGPMSVLGVSGLPQRFALICSLLMVGFLRLPARTERLIMVSAAGLLIFVTAIRWRDYHESSNCIRNEYVFLKTILPTHATVLTLEDDLGGAGVPWHHFIPHRLHLMFQTYYQIMAGGCDPNIFGTGYVQPGRELYTVMAGLLSRHAPNQFLTLRGDSIPQPIEYIILHTHSRWGDEMSRALQSDFSPQGQTEIAPGLRTMVLKRLGEGARSNG